MLNLTYSLTDNWKTGKFIGTAVCCILRHTYAHSCKVFCWWSGPVYLP